MSAGACRDLRRRSAGPCRGPRTSAVISRPIVGIKRGHPTGPLAKPPPTTRAGAASRRSRSPDEGKVLAQDLGAWSIMWADQRKSTTEGRSTGSPFRTGPVDSMSAAWRDPFKGCRGAGSGTSLSCVFPILQPLRFQTSARIRRSPLLLRPLVLAAVPRSGRWAVWTYVTRLVALYPGQPASRYRWGTR